MKTSSVITFIITTLGIGIGAYFFVGTNSSNTETLTNVPTQQFLLKMVNDTIVETTGGLTIFIPQDAFVDQAGNVVKHANLEVKEVDKISDAIQNKVSNISTDGDALQSEKTFQIVAKTPQGEELQINPTAPITVEIPTQEKDLSLYKGEQDENGNLVWKPTKQEKKKYLQAVELTDLDFLPDGFENGAKTYWVFSEEPTKERIDSVYYTLICSEHIEEWVVEHDEVFEVDFSTYSDHRILVTPCDKRINPATIKTIKTKKFEGTLIATKEFEERLELIHQTCDNSILELYINNLDKNLWEIDEMVVQKLTDNPKLVKEFQAFANQKLTNVKDSPSGKKLARYYKKKLNKVEKDILKQQKKYAKELKEARKKFEKDLKKIDKAIAKTKQKYSKLLTKRRQYKEKKHNVTITQNGVYSLGRQLKTHIITVKVFNGYEYDRVHVYIINEEIQSLWAMTSHNKVNFDGAYGEDPVNIVRKGQSLLAIAVAYKGDQIAFVAQNFKDKKVINIDLTLLPTTEQAFDETIKSFDTYKKENKISKDLKFQQKMYEQQEKRKALVEKEQNRNHLEHQKQNFLAYLNKFTYGCNAPEKNIFGVWKSDETPMITFNRNFTYVVEGYESTFQIKEGKVISKYITWRNKSIY